MSRRNDLYGYAAIACFVIVFIASAANLAVLVTRIDEINRYERMREKAEVEEPEKVTATQPRSRKWPALKRKHLAEHPVCEACWSDVDLNVHHVKPFHLYPELELEPSNLITLCRDHHLSIGHDPDGPLGPERPDWKAENVNVRDHAKQYREGSR